MESLEAIASHWTEWILSMTAQLLLLVGVLLIADRLLRRQSASIRYGLWSLVLLRLILPPTLALPTGWGWWIWPETAVAGSQQAAQAATPPRQDGPAPGTPGVVLDAKPTHSTAFRDAHRIAKLDRAATGESERALAAEADSTPLAIGESSAPRSSQPEHSRDGPVMAAASATVRWLDAGCAWVVDRVNAANAHVTNWRDRLGSWATVLLLIYLGIVCAQLGVLASTALQVRGWVRRATIITDQQVQAVLDECREMVGIQGLVELRDSESCTTPLVVGIFRPVILMPSTVLARLDRNELESVLIHELHHVRRRDPLVNVLQTILGIAYFFHPLVWYSNARIRGLREDVCDEFTLHTITSGPKSYGTALLKVAEVNGFAAPPLALGILDGQSPLRKRMVRILDPRTARNNPWTALAWLLPLLCALVLLPCGARQSSANGRIQAHSATPPATPPVDARTASPLLETFSPPAVASAPLTPMPASPATSPPATPAAPAESPPTAASEAKSEAPTTTVAATPKRQTSPVRGASYFSDEPPAAGPTRYQVVINLQTGDRVRRLEGELSCQWLLVLMDAHDMTAMIRPKFDRKMPPNNGFPELLMEPWFNTAHAQGWSRMGVPLTTDGKPLPLVSRSFASLLLPRLPQAGQTNSTYHRPLHTNSWGVALQSSRGSRDPHSLFPARIPSPPRIFPPPFFGGPFASSPLGPFAQRFSQELMETATTEWTPEGVTEKIAVGASGRTWVTGWIQTRFGAAVGSPIETNVAIHSLNSDGEVDERFEILFRQLTETRHPPVQARKGLAPPLESTE